MIDLIENIDNRQFVQKLFLELSKLPFGNLPKIELELVILHSIIEANGGYEKLNEITPSLQRNLKLSQTKFKNKILEAQLRFDNREFSVPAYLRNQIIEKDISELIIDDKYLSVYISNPLHLDIIKTYFDSNEILNDTSFNKNVVNIQTKGLLKILVNILNQDQLRKIESHLKSHNELKNKSFSLIGNVKIDSLFSTEISIDPLKSVSKLLDFVKNTLNLK